MMNHAQILVAEDEAIVAKDVSTRLRHMGYAVPAVAPTGEEAVEQTDAMRPDLVLMDIRLRGKLDGIEAATQIRRRHDVPIIYLTAYADDDTVAHSFQTMMAELSGIVRNTCRRHGAEPSEPTFRMITTPNPKQARALALLDTIRV